MIVVGWKTSAPDITTGAGFGIRVKKEDRDEYFRREWSTVYIELEQGTSVGIKLTDSFWEDCIELRSNKIGKWMLNHGLAPWPAGMPPNLKLIPIGDSQFRLETA